MSATAAGPATTPHTHLVTVAGRSRIRSRMPALAERCHRLLRLAELAAQGPDSEAALPQLAAAANTLRSFLHLTK